MIRVVIVEDEMLVRIGMKMCIEEYDPQITVAKAFSNAEEALDYFKSETADVLVTDIQLTGLNGLGLIREIREKYPQMVIIIISCYEDFSYAKEAIALKVDRYVLKHEIDEEELPRLIMEQYHQKHRNRDQDAWEYMAENQKKDAKDFGELFFVATFVLRRTGDSQNTTEEDINFKILSEILQKHMSDEGLGECFLHHAGEICALFRFSQKNRLQQAKEQIHTFWQEAAVSVQNYFDRNLYMILSQPFFDLTMTKEQYRLVIAEASRAFYYSRPACICLDTKPMQQSETLTLKLAKTAVFQDSWYEATRQEVGLFLKRCCSAAVPASSAKAGLARFLNELEIYLEQNYNGVTFAKIFSDQRYLSYQYMECFDSAAQLQQELFLELEAVMQYIQKKHDSFYAVEQYIREHFTSRISLVDVAEHFHMNTVYFCQYFKKKKGITYVQFLNQIRIEEAKKLLRQEAFSTRQISEMVGIPNANYFLRLFKKTTGMTVSEYQKLKL